MNKTSAEIDACSDEIVRRKQSPVLPRYASTILAQGTLLALGVVTSTFSARLLGPSGRGILAAITLWPMALAFFFSCGINQAIVFHLSKLHYSCRQIYGAFLGIVAGQSVFVVLAGIFVLPIALRRYPPEALRLGFWFLAFVPLVILGGCFASVLLAMRDVRSFNVARTIAPVTYFLGLALISFTGNPKMATTQVVTAQLASHAVAFFIGIGLMITKFPMTPEISKDAIGSLIGYGVRAQVTNLTTYLNQRADQLVLSLLVSPRELGLYAAAVSLAGSVAFVPQAAGLVTFADGASQQGLSVKRTIGASFRLSFAWLCTASVLLWIAAPFLVTLALGKDFEGASTACRVLLPGMVAAGLNQVLYAAANAMGRPALPSFAELVGMVVTVIGFVALVPLHGYVAAAAISTIAYVTSFIVMIWLSAKSLQINVYELLFRSWIVPRGRRYEEQTK